MKILKSQMKCPHCNKSFELYIETLPTKMDDRRESYYLCPYCNRPAGKLLLQGNEEDKTCKLEK